MENSTKCENKYRDAFVRNTRFQYPTEQLESALNSVADFVGELGAEHLGKKSSPHWLTLSGVSGCGKTMLAKEVYAFAEKYMSFAKDPELNCGSYREIQFRTILDMADEWRDGVWRNEWDEKAWLLVIDDLGAERDASGFVKDRLFNLLSKRLGKWTLITTNLKLKAIQNDYDVRIASRIIRDGNRYRPFKSGDWWLSQSSKEDIANG